MGFNELEAAGKKALEQFPVVKRSAKRVYQIASVITNRDKVKAEGQIIRVSPDDKYEYFYGYYDKSPWDVTDRYMLCVQVQQAYKSVAPSEPGTVCLIDTHNNNKLIKIGITHSWNVQQSCMAQWLGPDFKSRIIYNDYRDGHYCSVIYNVENMKEERVLPLPVYDVARDGSFALSLDFNRLHRMRPGYGYSNQPDRSKGLLCPDKTCIWKIDIETGKVEKLFKYTDFATFETDETMNGAEHKVNHLMISPNGKRFMVLHRWFDNGRKHTRLVTVNVDKTEMYNLSDDVFVSHCYWKNDEEILSFLRKKETGDHYYLMKDKTQEYRMFWPELNTDGHCSYSPDGSFVITDTYPNRNRIASVYLCTEEDDRSRRIARVCSPFKYDNDCRCDLHPRWNHKGDKVCIDSVHEGKRGLYVLAINKIRNSILNKKNSFKQNSQKLISFIIPAYNSGKTINRCIDSLIQQTLDNWEAVIVNDGSTDDTLDVLKQYNNDNRIRIVNQKNAGPGIARNQGIQNARGEYVSFLDSDDYIDNCFVELLQERIINTNADVVFYESYYEDEKGKILKTTRIYSQADKSKNDFITAQLSGTFSWGADKVIRLSLIQSASAFFIGQDVGEEALFTFQILEKANTIEFVKQPLYHYVQSNEGQHKKGENDPLKEAVHSVDMYMTNNGYLPEYQFALNNMAYKALSMSLYRIAIGCTFNKAIKLMGQKMKYYNSTYDIQNVNTAQLSRSAKMLYPFIRHRFIIPIYFASKIRNNNH